MPSKSCGLKWHQKIWSLHLNQASSCCRAHAEVLDASKPITFYLDKWQDESQQLDQGVKLLGCEYCWKDEDRGLSSYRLEKPNLGKNNMIEIYMSNLCNQMCSYCSPRYSNIWQAAMIDHGPFTGVSATANFNLTPLPQADDHSEYWLSQLSDYVNSCPDNSISIKLLGGEPLMQVKSLEKLLSFNKNKIQSVIIITNLNPPSNKFLHWLLDNIPKEKLIFQVSLDSTPDYNHIPRAGFTRATFLENLNLLIQNQINFELRSVVSVLNMFDLENFIPWVTQNNFKTEFSKINNPLCLSPECLPKEFRVKIQQKIQNLEIPVIIRELLENPNDVVDLKLFEQYNYLTQYFERSNIDPAQVNNALFVEYWTWLGNFVQERFKR